MAKTNKTATTTHGHGMHFDRDASRRGPLMGVLATEEPRILLLNANAMIVG